MGSAQTSLTPSITTQAFAEPVQPVRKAIEVTVNAIFDLDDQPDTQSASVLAKRRVLISVAEELLALHAACGPQLEGTDHPFIHTVLQALVAEACGQDGTALELDYRSLALARRPSQQAKAHNNASVGERRRGNTAKAIEHAEAAVRLFPTAGWAIANLLLAHHASWRVPEEVVSRVNGLPASERATLEAHMRGEASDLALMIGTTN